MKHYSFSLWHVLGVGIILIALRFYPAILEGKVTVFGDNYSLQVPGRIFTGYWLKQGIIPWWNPTIFAGIPWSQEISQTVFYPSMLLFTFINPGLALNLTIAFHLLFTYWGMYLLTKRWTNNDFAGVIGAILWTFSTQVTGSSNNLVTIQSISWFPWVAYWGLRLFDSKKIPLWYSLCVLGQFLGGYPQHVVYAIVLSVMLSAITSWHHMKWFDWLKQWILTGLMTIGITAVAWVPFIEIFLNSTRAIQTNAQAGVGSLHPLMLIKMVLPYFFDNPAAGMKWGPAWSGFPNVVFYFTWIGIVLLVLAIRKHHSIPLFLFALLTIFISMGSYLPVFPFIQNIIPFFKVSRGPSILLICTTIIFILILTKEIPVIKTWKVKKTVFGVIVLVCALLLGGLTTSQKTFNQLWTSADGILHHKLSSSVFHTPERDFALVHTISINVFVNAGLLLLVLLMIHYRKTTFIVLAIGIDMLFNTQGMLLFAQKDIYPSWSEILQRISSQPTQLSDSNYRTLTRNMNTPYTDFAMYWEAMTVRKPFSDSFIDSHELQSSHYLRLIRDSFTPDWNMVYQVPVIHGYTTLLPKNYDALWDVDNNPGINAIDKIASDSALLKQWAVRNYVVDKQFTIKEALPGNPAASLSNMVDLYTLPALTRFRYEDDSPIDISTLKENLNEITLTINNQNHTSLILADRYDKNWQATVNGQSVQITNLHGMRSIQLVPGVNNIRFRFTPLFFIYGVLITIVTTISSVLWLRTICKSEQCVIKS